MKTSEQSVAPSLLLLLHLTRTPGWILSPTSNLLGFKIFFHSWFCSWSWYCSCSYSCSFCFSFFLLKPQSRAVPLSAKPGLVTQCSGFHLFCFCSQGGGQYQGGDDSWGYPQAPTLRCRREGLKIIQWNFWKKLQSHDKLNALCY